MTSQPDGAESHPDPTTLDPIRVDDDVDGDDLADYQEGIDIDDDDDDEDEKMNPHSAASSYLVDQLPLDALAATASSFASVHGILVERRQTDHNVISQHLAAAGKTPLNSPTSASAAASASAAQAQQQNRTKKKKQQQRQQSYFECAPISLLPNAFPKTAFQQAMTVAPLFNALVEMTSQNVEFLQTTLQQVVEVDRFTAKLLQLYQDIYFPNKNNNENNDTTKRNFARQADRLGLFRSDYMLHEGCIKQVELNTIAASFGALSTRVAALHRHLIATKQDTDTAVQEFLEQNQKAVLSSTVTTTGTTNDQEAAGVAMTTEGADQLDNGVPPNFALERLAEALHLAAQNFQKRFGDGMKKMKDPSSPPAAAAAARPPVILFVVQPGETNTADQRLLEFQITQVHGWRVLRQSLTELSSSARVDDTTGLLIVQEPTGSDSQPPLEHFVAVVYYRAGYSPTDYFGDDEWNARTLMEQSVATKCPCLGYHLVGTKKVQQAMARPDVLESLWDANFDIGGGVPVKPDDAVAQLRSVFAGLYSLGSDMVEEDYAAVRAIVQEGQASQFVLKPQREGGGYNFYGKQMEERLQLHVTIDDNDDKNNETNMKVDHSVLGEFILMQRLFPPEQRAVLLRSGQVEGSGPSISELGCFGTILVTPSEEDKDSSATTTTASTTPPQIHGNHYAGFLMRTKFSHVDEGGVAAGFATLSSPYLV